MPNYDCLSGTRYTVKARNEDEAREKLGAYWAGLNCPCGFPQWAEQAHAEGHELCTCVEEMDVDTSIQIVHVDGHPEEDKTFVCPACKKTQPWDFGGAPCLACNDCHYTHDENGGDCIDG